MHALNRHFKIVLVGSIGLYTLIVAFNNLTDYDTNFRYVEHVMSMDSTFPNNNSGWRAIKSPWLHHLAYIAIILCELAIAALCALGGWRMWRSMQSDNATFRARQPSCYGRSGIGFRAVVHWFFGHRRRVFLMWQSADWNASDLCFDLSLLNLLALVYINLQESANTG